KLFTYTTLLRSIANIDTPNYKTQDVSFKSLIQKETNNLQLKNTNERHLQRTMDPSSHYIKRKTGTTFNHNGNNVDIDKEMADLAENQIFHRSLIDRMNGKFRTIQN